MCDRWHSHEVAYRLGNLTRSLEVSPPEIAAARVQARDLIGWLDSRCDLVPILSEVDDLLRTGEVAEALHRLDRWIHPKFDSTEDCRRAYAEAMEARSHA